MSLSRVVPLILVVALFAACSRPGGPDKANEFSDAGVQIFTAGIRCDPARSAEPLPARSSVTSGTGAITGDIYFTNVLFDRFRSECGGCHVDGAQGGFAVTRTTFAKQITQMVVDQRIKTDDSTLYMPPAGAPNGKPYSQRSANDPVVQLVTLLQLWIKQGSPVGTFQLSLTGAQDAGATSEAGPPTAATAPAATDPPTQETDASADGDQDGDQEAGPPLVAAPADYGMTPQLGSQQTNIGSCIPNKYVVGINTTSMNELDRFFANTSELPDTLAETDLTTFDSDELARNGVISYLPAYPLWSDDAGKMRHVRVPRGQPITFDKEKQQFQIPPNTRFYKTFLKKVIDASGNDAYKKIETRLIVSRPDQTLADGTIKQTALFGTYIWDEAETKADLLKDPYRSGEPFSDRLVSYITDEPKAAAIIATKPPNIDYVLEVENPGLVRHYAIPGSERCTQCHMGSPSASFVLGFTPLEVATIPPGTSGVIEPAMGDELTQLKRLIDYNVISGMTAASDVRSLEESQLPRKPRNAYELTAQAYMVGNCAHCHNPRGFPSTKAPELKGVLNFLPSSEGGIFQFPLDRTSPIRQRNVQQDVPIPYITPSLRDFPEESAEYPGYIAQKWVLCTEDENDGWCLKPKQAIDFVDAPWRSLIYRNVDTPFDYVDDYAIFPHMPMNTPGYDCRVPRIMGDWMVSIPATRVNKVSGEDVVPDQPGILDTSPQPYAEVLPADPAYGNAQLVAYQRLAAYHAGHRYGFCPDTRDISDPAVLAGDQLTPQDTPLFDPNNPTRLVMPQEGVPNHANWVVTDVSDPPGDWAPRRPDWAAALVQHEVVSSGLKSPDDIDHLERVIDKLKTISLSDDVRSALTKELPFGLWKPKAGCTFAGVPTAASFQGDDRPLWMSISRPQDVNAPVYTQSAGAAVFTNICINCHGPQADAKGLLADEITIMTGGDARVANFRIGLFGPSAAPGMNRQRVFAPPAVMPSTGTPDDYGARYMAYMALGGTEKVIPRSLLTIVATTPVLGERRSFVTAGSPNMLELAQQLCTHVLPADTNVADYLLSDLIFRHGVADITEGVTDLIGTNGDAELWLRLCTLNNRPIVRVVLPTVNSWDKVNDPSKLSVQKGSSLYWGDGYPAGAPVMDDRGHVTNGISPSNLFPFCVKKPANATEAGLAEAFLNAHPVGGSSVIPFCPAELFATARDDMGGVIQKWQLQSKQAPTGIVFTDALDWGIRGAINAGMAVFLYVDGIAKGTIVPKPAYNQCDLRGSSAGH